MLEYSKHRFRIPLGSLSSSLLSSGSEPCTKPVPNGEARAGLPFPRAARFGACSIERALHSLVQRPLGPYPQVRRGGRLRGTLRRASWRGSRSIASSPCRRPPSCTSFPVWNDSTSASSSWSTRPRILSPLCTRGCSVHRSAKTPYRRNSRFAISRMRLDPVVARYILRAHVPSSASRSAQTRVSSGAGSRSWELGMCAGPARWPLPSSGGIGRCARPSTRSSCHCPSVPARLVREPRAMPAAVRSPIAPSFMLLATEPSTGR